MTEAEIDKLLEDAQGPNIPQALPGSGLTGPREKITPEQARERRMALAQVMENTSSRDAVFRIFTIAPWNLSEDTILRLMADVRRMWADEEGENQQSFRARAIRRLEKHILQAQKAGKWTAVAALETQLAKIQGTEAPEPNTGTGDDTRFTEAVMAQLQVKDPTQLRIMVERQRIYIDTGSLPAEPRHRPKAVLTGGGPEKNDTP